MNNTAQTASNTCPNVAVKPRISGISGIYAITPEIVDDAKLLSLVDAALAGGVRILQYRGKNLSAEKALSQALALQKLCKQADALFIVNDSATFAANIGASACHLGREDGGVSAARTHLPQGIIGVSCYNDLARAQTLSDEGADYLAFGAAFASSVKPNAPHADLSVFKAARAQFQLPIVAIGGITLANAPALINAGVDAIAVISDLFSAPNVEARAMAFSKLFN